MNVMKTNALSVFLAAKYASRAMLKTSEAKPYPSGSIIATASVAGLRSNAGPSDYSASKAAVVSLMQTCAYQLVGTGIRCNAVCPGLIETGMTKVTYDAARKRGSESKIGQLNPLRRGGQPDEVSLLFFLWKACCVWLRTAMLTIYRLRGRYCSWRVMRRAMLMRRLGLWMVG